MKKLFFILLVLLFAEGLSSQSITNYTVCKGQLVTINAANTANLSNPVYSLAVIGQTNTTGTFTLYTPISSTYSIFVTGQDAQNATVTNTTIHYVLVGSPSFAGTNVVQASCGNTVAVVSVTPFSSAAAQGAYILWNPPPLTLNSTSTMATYPVPMAGTLQVTATAYDPLGCSASTTALVNPMPPMPTFTVLNLSNTNSITCLHPSVFLNAISSYNYNNGTLNYLWTSGSSTFSTNNIVVTTPGTYTVIGIDPVTLCSFSTVTSVGINTAVPSSTVTPLTQNITCSLTSVIAVTAVANPSFNVTSSFMSPFGGTFSAQSYTATYPPMAPGTYTHCLINDNNGCSTCKTFTVTTNQGLPTFNVISPQNFTLGCSSKSVAVINIVNASTQMPAGGPVSYTVIGPPTSTSVQSGTLSAQATYSMNIPGTWTVITRDNFTFCESRVPVSIISNITPPNIIATMPTQVMTCTLSQMTLMGISTTPNVSYLWTFPGTPGSIPNNTLNVVTNTTAPTNSIIANYTLTITDNNNLCKSTTVVPVYQNIYPPKAMINPSLSSLSCLSPTVILVNASASGIPNSFPHTLPVIAEMWEDPSPQIPLQFSTTYLASSPGTYTLHALDLNNGCRSTTIATISDSRIYPAVNAPPDAFLLPCPGLATITPVISGSPAGFTYSWATPLTASVTGANSATLITNTPGFYTVTVTNTVSGCATKAILAVYACVGLKENLLSEGISVFPNPGSGFLNIHFDDMPSNAVVEVYSSIGALVCKKQVISEKMQVDIQQQPAGIYLLRVQQGENILKVFKVVKE